MFIVSLQQILLAMLMSFILSGTDIILPNNYKLIDDHGVVAIVRMSGESRGDVVVGPNVTRYAVTGDLIVGIVEAHEDPDMAALGEPGHFILETATGEVRIGLSEDAWRADIKGRGIPTPTLRAPK